MILHKEVILRQVVIARWAILEMTFIDMGKKCYQNDLTRSDNLGKLFQNLPSREKCIGMDMKREI